MVWFCFTATGPGRFAVFKSTMNSSVYQNIHESKLRQLSDSQAWPKFLHKKISDWLSDIEDHCFKILQLKVLLQATGSWFVFSFSQDAVLWKSFFFHITITDTISFIWILTQWSNEAPVSFWRIKRAPPCKHCVTAKKTEPFLSSWH